MSFVARFFRGRAVRVRLLPLTVAAATAVLLVRVGDLVAETRAEPAAPVVVSADAATEPPPAAPAEAGARVAEGADDAEAARDIFAYSPAEIRLLQQLAERRDAIEARARDVELRERLLAAMESRIDRKAAELDRVKGEIEAKLRRQGEREEAQLAQLVDIYERMKPREAARIFNELDLDMLVDLVGRMNERRSSPIIAEMAPAKARALTARLGEPRARRGADG